jgi:O26-antigen biosynthesis N-acetyl-L-fucosamine transferase
LRVLLLVDCYYPSTKSSAKLVHDLAMAICSRDNEAIILAPSDTISEKIETSREDGVLVVRVKTGAIKGTNNVARATREARLSGMLWNAAQDFLRQNPCDLIIFYSPTIFFGPLVRRLKRLWSCPAYLILRDIFPDWALDAGILRKGLIYEFFRRVAGAQYRIADVIAVQSPANLKYFARAFPDEQFQLEVLFNWTALTEDQLVHTDYRASLGLQEKTVFLYGGNLGVAQDIDNIFRLAARLAYRPNIHFLLVGEGREVPRLKKRIEADRIANLEIISARGQDDYLSLVSEFDVGLISLDARLKTQNVPGKLLGYLYWGLPVLASINPGNDLFWMLQDHGAGLCCLNGDDEGLLRDALRLADDPELRAAMGQNGRRLLRQTFSAENAVTQIFTHLFERGLLPVPRNFKFVPAPTSGFHTPELAGRHR